VVDDAKFMGRVYAKNCRMQNNLKIIRDRAISVDINKGGKSKRKKKTETLLVYWDDGTQKEEGGVPHDKREMWEKERRTSVRHRIRRANSTTTKRFLLWTTQKSRSKI